MKKLLFKISLLFLPFLFFFIIEVLLRIVNFGETYPLVTESAGRYKINQTFARKYFTQDDIIIPQIIEQTFSKTKPEHTKRIICMGGSTTAGFPYEENINFPVFLKQQMKHMWPEYDYEVINLGISAVNSNTVLDMLPDVFELDPDLIILYAGHNEFYGALGGASTEYIGSNRLVIKTVLFLREIRLYQLMQKGLGLIRNLFADEHAAPTRGTLMNRMIKNANIQPDGSIASATYRNFEANLLEIVKLAKRENIPLVIGEVVSNIKDQQPLSADTFDQIPEVQNIYQIVNELIDAESFNEAIHLLEQSFKDDDKNPLFHYYLGKCYFQIGQHSQAKEHYILARDYDFLPFRAPSSVNQIINKVAKQEQIALAKVDSIFTYYSPHGITDNRLFLEHLHPNADGYFLIALSFAEAIFQSGWFPETSRKMIGLDNYRAFAAFTELDLAIGDLKIENLINDFPFNGRTNFQRSIFAFEPIFEIAYQHVYQQKYWDAAHFDLGDLYLASGQIVKAEAEYKAVLMVDETNPTALYKLGDAAQYRKAWHIAEKYYKTAIAHQSGASFLHAKLGKVQIISNQFEEGIQNLQTVIALENNKSKLGRDEMKTVRYLLAVGLANQNMLQEARKELQECLLIDPRYIPALELMNQLDNVQSMQD